MGYHARLGPSSAYRWSTCTAAPNAEDGLPNDGNPASRAGTAEHQAAAECLELDRDPWDYLGMVMVFVGKDEHWQTSPDDKGDHLVTLDEDAIERVATYVEFVRDLVQTSGGVLLVEQRVSIDFITGEGHWHIDGVEVPEGTPGAVWKPAGGTSDAIIITDDEITVVDAKFGQMGVRAYDVQRAEGRDPISGYPTPAVLTPNRQGAMYGAGALHDFGWMAPGIKRVRIIIVQPKLASISEFAITVEELNAFVDVLRLAATETRENPTYRPSEEACGFCRRAKVGCKARDTHVLSMVFDGFKDGDVAALVEAKPKVVHANWLGAVYEKLDTITGWVNELHRRVYQELSAGKPVIGTNGSAYKLVDGRMGHRYWKDDSQVEADLRKAGLPESAIYNRKVISPADAEKLATAKRPRAGKPGIAAAIGPDQWTRLQECIGQDRGMPSIVPGTDPRPAVKPATDGFSDSTTPSGDADLFA